MYKVSMSSPHYLSHPFLDARLTLLRCPLEINLINTSQAPGEWRCELYLVKNYYFDGTKTAASKDRPYGPWIPQGQENYLFATTNSKDDLRDLIARAQLAILNPSMNPAQYLHQAPSDRANHRQVKFSPNVIRLDIFSTEVSELSLFDLPGVITVPETDDERYLVGIVDKLVRSYTSSSQSIILLALPMTNDATNSKAVNIIQRSGAKHRTVGVLTKPDLFQLSESFEQWLDILWGYKFDLGHGYFVVCNAADVSVGHAEARAHERRFFATPPWASAPLAELSDRFGTDNLSKQLQCLLEKRIQDGLPAIHESIDARIAVITEDLKKLPAPRDMPAVLTISQSLNTCNRGLEALFSSSSRSGETFRREWNGLAKRFRAVLERSRPRMKRRSKAEEKKTEKLAQLRQTPAVQENADSQVINVESEPEDCPPTPSVGEKRKRNNPWDEFSGVEYYLDDIRAIINDYASNIPNLLNPRAIEVMNQQSVQHWSLPLNYFLDQVQRLISAHIKAVVTKAFDPQQQKARLHEQVMLQVDGFINTSMAAQVSKVEDMVSIEVMCPYTSDEHAMKRERNAIWEILSRARLETRLSDAGQTMTPKKGQPRVAAESLGPDEWVREVEMFSTVRAYYQIAFSRFADNILQVTQCNLFSALRTGLSDQLDSYFSVTTKAGQELCEELLADDPDVINARRELREEIMRLERARAEIETVFAADSATNDAYGGLNDNSQGAGNGDKSASTMENGKLMSYLFGSSQVQLRHKG